MRHIIPNLATIPVAIIAISTLATPALAVDPSPSSSSQSAPQVSEVELPHPLAAADAFEVVESEDAEVVSATLTVDKAIAVYQYDDEQSDSANATNADQSLTDLVGGSGVVTSVTVADEAQGTATQSARSRSSDNLDDRIIEAAEAEPEAKADSVDAVAIRDDFAEETYGSTDDRGVNEISPQAASDHPETLAHANRTVFKTEDSVSGKREVTMEMQWINNSNLVRLYDDWGFENDLYQWNNKLSSTAQRPACPKDTDTKFWANASLKGGTAVFIFNEGLSSAKNKAISPYLDRNHLSDTCNQGTIGIGIGEPKKIPNYGGGEAGQKINQRAFVRLSLLKGNASWSHISSASSFLPNNCPKGVHQDCMGLHEEPGNTWSEKNMGGDTDTLLLNKKRGWKTPAYFSWDEFASKRPQGIGRG